MKWEQWLTEREQLDETYARTYSPTIDGEPFNPPTISAAETQIMHMASMVFSSFGVDPQFESIRQDVLKARQLMDDAAKALGRNADELRNVPHKYSPQGRDKETGQELGQTMAQPDRDLAA